jgi:two-component system, chemotaxis family, sensor kinase CheA
LLGGSIQVESKKGRGTTFILQLPLVSTDASLGIAEQVAAESRPETKRIKKKEHRQGATILLVDDNADSRYAVKMILEEMGFQIISCGDGEESIKLARQKKPDLILMDIMLPVLSGYEAVERMRSKKMQMPIIAMSAHAAAKEKLNALHSGFSDYLSKPFTVDDVKTMINKWL